jgi:exosortase
VFWGIFFDTLRWIINSWRHNSFYTHGFIIFSICLALIILNGIRLKETDFEAEPGLLPGAVFVILVISGFTLRFDFLLGLAYIAGALSLSMTVIAREQWAFIQLPFLLMITVLPIPFLNEVSGYLSYAASKTSAFILGTIYSSVEVDGIAVIIPGGVSFNIDINCSGANSILALITIVILWMATLKNNSRITSGLIALTLPVGFLTNVLRIVLIFIAARIWGMEYALEFWHDFAAYFFFLISLGILFLAWIYLKRMSNDEIKLRRLLIA